MSAWQHILGVAAVGTERQGLTLPADDSPLGRALDKLDVADREGALLGAVALTSLHRLAGLRAASDSLPMPEACGAERLARCSAASGQHLALMLAGEYREVLPEWLEALRVAGRRVSEEHLPALLDKGTAERALRTLVVGVLGERGRWLAAQNEAWAWASANLGPESWETGERNERILLLRSLRATDPRRAREMLSSTWKAEPAKDRYAFLPALHVGLGEEDEPFLVEALEDRSAEVRREAAELLLRLPSSSLTRHVTERVSSLLGYRKPTLRKPLIEVSLPEDPEAWQKENRIPLETPAASDYPAGMGRKGWWLLHAVGRVPPSVWCGLWGKRPAELIEAAHNGEWGEALVQGFAEAAGRHGDAEWAEALLVNERRRQPSTPHDMSVNVRRLAAHVPPARLEALIIKELDGGKGAPRLDQQAVLVLLEHRARWGAALSRAVVSAVKDRVKGAAVNNLADWQLKSALRQFARHVSPEVADELTAPWPVGEDVTWRGPVEEFKSTVAFRRDMLRAVVKEETEV